MKIVNPQVERCVEEVAKEAREQQNWEYDATDGSITQTPGVTFDEEPIQGPGEVVESPRGTVVTLRESETDKKVRYRRNKKNRSKEKEGWAMRTWNGKNSNSSILLEGLRCDEMPHRYVIYQELCV